MGKQCKIKKRKLFENERFSIFSAIFSSRGLYPLIISKIGSYIIEWCLTGMKLSNSDRGLPSGASKGRPDLYGPWIEHPYTGEGFRPSKIQLKKNNYQALFHHRNVFNRNVALFIVIHK